MKRVKFLSILFGFLVLFGSCLNTGSKDKSVANPEQVALADSILLYFQQEQFDKIVPHFDDKMKLALNKEQLAVVWAQLSTQVGKYTKSEFHGAQKISAIGDRIVYTCYFGSQKLYFQLVFGKDNQVSGLYFKPQPN